MKIKIILLLLVMVFINQGNAQSNTTANYFCNWGNNETGFFCIPDINKNNIAANLSEQYVVAINDLELIQNSNPSFNQSGFNQIVWAIKREAQIDELILKFLKIIYNILT